MYIMHDIHATTRRPWRWECWVQMSQTQDAACSYREQADRLLVSRAGGDCTLERGSWWRRGIGAARTSPATTSAHRLLLLPAAACPAHDRPLQTRTGTQRRGFCRQRRCRGRGRGQESRAPRPGPRGGLVGHCAAHRPRPVQLRAPNWPWRGPWLVQRAVPVAACL